MSSATTQTTNHDTIRLWVEDREGEPWAARHGVPADTRPLARRGSLNRKIPRRYLSDRRLARSICRRLRLAADRLSSAAM